MFMRFTSCQDFDICFVQYLRWYGAEFHILLSNLYGIVAWVNFMKHRNCFEPANYFASLGTYYVR